MLDILGSISISDATNPVWWLLDTVHDTIEGIWNSLSDVIKGSTETIGSGRDAGLSS